MDQKEEQSCRILDIAPTIQNQLVPIFRFFVVSYYSFCPRRKPSFPCAAYSPKHPTLDFDDTFVALLLRNVKGEQEVSLLEKQQESIPVGASSFIENNLRHSGSQDHSTYCGLSLS
jgi:hypothetical protein